MPEISHREFLDSNVLARLSALTLNARIPMLGSVTGIHKSATRGSSVEFAEYRKYVPGDDIKHVDWRVFGRTDRFFMKEFEADTNLRCQIILDTSASMKFASKDTTKFDYARKIAATLGWLLIHQGDAVGITCFADKSIKDISPSRSPSHLKIILDILAQAKPDGGTDIIKILHAMAEKTSQRAVIIVISDFFAEPSELLNCFQHMRFQKHDLAVFHLLDRQEIQFDFDRPIRFTDMESPFDLITDPSVIRSGYLDEIHKYLEAMERGSHEHGVDYRRAFTDESYEQIVAKFMLERLRNKQRR